MPKVERAKNQRKFENNNTTPTTHVPLTEVLQLRPLTVSLLRWELKYRSPNNKNTAPGKGIAGDMLAPPDTHAYINANPVSVCRQHKELYAGSTRN